MPCPVLATLHLLTLLTAALPTFYIFMSYRSNPSNCIGTASPKVLKIFSHPQTRDQSQVVQNDKLSQESVETKIFVGGNGTFSHFFEKKLKKMWKKISKKNFFFTKICFSGLEKPYVQLLVLNFFSDFDLQKLIFGNFEEFGLFFEVF